MLGGLPGYTNGTQSPSKIASAEELPETFVGMSTALSAQERNLMLTGLPGYINGTQSPSQIASAVIECASGVEATYDFTTLGDCQARSKASFGSQKSSFRNDRHSMTISCPESSMGGDCTA